MSYRIQKASQRGRDPTVKCLFCSKRLSSARSLRLHKMAKHSSEFYQCHECDKKFFDIASLSKHFDQVHEEAIKCKECDAKFRQNSLLTKHNESFHGELPCTHPNCKHKLHTLEHLRTHMNTHHDDPAKFPCKDCDESYGSAATLLKHMESIHVDHSCICDVEGCGAKLNHPVALRKHIKQYHDTEFRNQSTCKTCGRYFKGGKKALASHMNTVHWLENFKRDFGKTKNNGNDESYLESLIPLGKLSINDNRSGSGVFIRTPQTPHEPTAPSIKS